MNKFKLLVITLVLGTTTLFASTSNNPEISKDDIRKQIIELVQSSDITLDNQVTVNVTFTFSSEGELVVLKVNSTDKEVLNFIRETLNAKKLENPGKAYKHYTLAINVS